MKTRVLLCGWMAGLVLAVTARGENRVFVGCDVADQAVAQEFVASQVVPVTLYASRADGSPIFGVDLDVAVTTPDVRIASVTFDPAFARSLGSGNTELPGAHYHAVRVQPLRNLDRTLGADGAPIPFAMIELEVLNGAAFTSALEITARVALIGAVPETTTVLGVESTSRAPRPGRITIINTAPAAETEGAMLNGLNAAGPSEGDTPESDPWTTETASLALEVQPLGGGEPLTVLTPDTTYELHYAAGYKRVAWYVLFAVATSADQGFAAVTAPESGDWSSAGDFSFVNMDAEPDGPTAAPNYPDGTYRQQMASADFWPETTDYAGSQGHLCNFTTGSTGELNLELYMAWIDEAAFQSVDMQTQVTFVVEEPDAEGDQ